MAYAWLWLSVQQTAGDGLHICGLTIHLGCPSRLLLGIPCPGCGNTRSVLACFRGDLWQAIMFNPVGLLIALFIVVAPLWIALDWMRGSTSLLTAWCRTEQRLHNNRVIIVVILLTLCNWIWNIQKFG